MDTEIIVALITVAGAIIVALIGLIGHRKKSSSKPEEKTQINQNATGNINTQIGIQINKEKGDRNDA